VSCHQCVGEYTEKQRHRFRERERQIQLAKQRGEVHIGDDLNEIIAKRREEKRAFKEAQRGND